jgi:ribosome modulation factor
VQWFEFNPLDVRRGFAGAPYIWSASTRSLSLERIEQEGREAFATGIEMRRCPYRDASRRDAWLKGWVEARQASRMPG